MRKQSLRHAATLYLHRDLQGSFKDKKHAVFVIHKMIDTLFILGAVPASWQALTKPHLEKLIKCWHKNNIKTATIMDYMTTIRRFLEAIKCPLTQIDNKSLGLSRLRKRRKHMQITADIWLKLTVPMARIIMGMQTQFGLTFSEAIQVIPGVHVHQNRLWITREIAFNSVDRTIPIRTKNQVELLSELNALTAGCQSLLGLYSYDYILVAWRRALTTLNLSSNKTYRYLYAKKLKKDLLPVFGNYQTDWLIRDEMGIKSRTTLWSYLHE